MVGDMLADEICVGGEIGMKTVWFQQSRFGAIQSGEPPCVPHYTVHSIPELRELLKKI
jgi:FMN phosphatase YigB (HAD superfamily)